VSPEIRIGIRGLRKRPRTSPRSVTVVTCPAGLIRAPADRVWDLLTLPRELETWSGAKVLEGPSRPLVAGDDLVLGAGLAHRFRVHFHIGRAEPPEELAIEIRLPLGVTNREVIRIAAAGLDRCRVTFN
jgi:uncharacterized protein YndB with AHSA1/START domain